MNFFATPEITNIAFIFFPGDSVIQDGGWPRSVHGAEQTDSQDGGGARRWLVLPQVRDRVHAGLPRGAPWWLPRTSQNKGQHVQILCFVEHNVSCLKNDIVMCNRKRKSRVYFAWHYEICEIFASLGKSSAPPRFWSHVKSMVDFSLSQMTVI